MPEFERDAWGAQDAYEAQLRHYGIKQGVSPDARPAPRDPTVPARTKLTAGTGMPIPKRKPVPTADSALRGRSPRPVSPAPGSRSPRTQSPAYEPKPSRTQSPARTIKTIDGKFDLSTIQAPRQAPAPPASPTPTQQRGRTGTNSSVKSQSSRRGSFSRGLRRLSDAFKNKVDIVGMARSDRMDYVRTRSRDNSPARQPYPTTPTVASPGISSPRVASPIFDSGNRPSNPGKFMTPFDTPPATPSKALPGNLSKGEKFAMSVSKAADPFKPKRKGTQDSDMSFGMTDLAPPDQMDQCTGCYRPTDEYLIHGLCKQCHELHQRVAKAKKEGGMFVDPWQFPQGRSTWPDVPTADQKYMKLPTRKKILRIRDTIYEDPGNPFSEESIPASPYTLSLDTKPLPPIPAMVKERSGRVDSFDINPFEDGAFSRTPATPKNSVADAWVGNNATEADPDRIRSHRRSKSIAVPLANLNDERGEYVAPRTYWRGGSLPTSHMSQPIPPSHDAWRDTKFDEFYDGLLQDYNGVGTKK